MDSGEKRAKTLHKRKESDKEDHFNNYRKKGKNDLREGGLRVKCPHGNFSTGVPRKEGILGAGSRKGGEAEINLAGNWEKRKCFSKETL